MPAFFILVFCSLEERDDWRLAAEASSDIIAYKRKLCDAEKDSWTMTDGGQVDLHREVLPTSLINCGDTIVATFAVEIIPERKQSTLYTENTIGVASTIR